MMQAPVPAGAGLAGAVVGALLAGLAGSPHCVAMCGAFAATCGRAPSRLVAWHAGRLTTYAALGALAAGVGRILPGPPWLPALVALGFVVWFAASLAGLVREPRVALPGLGRLGSRALALDGTGGRFLFGLVNGLLPCGLVYGALSLAVATAEPAAGAVLMLVFGAGTLPALTLLAGTVQRVLRTHPWSRRAMAALVLLSGLGAIAARFGAGHDHQQQVRDGEPALHHHR